MAMQQDNQRPKRKDDRIIIHFDYDAFYCSVFEKEDPQLKYLPFAVQQKQIIVTCNYEARRRGLYKLQLITEAKKKCPNVIILLGEDLTRFRNASKDNYDFLRKYAWSKKVERLGFDEVFMDVTDMIDENMSLLNADDLPNSFFHLDRNDPTNGFAFDASRVSGHIFPVDQEREISSPSGRSPKSLSTISPPLSSLPPLGETDPHDFHLRLALGSSLAQYLRLQLEETKGYTSTVGISTTKLISKLVGNLNKPKGQTTLVPPYSCSDGNESNIIRFIDGHDIGKVPGIGFKFAQKIRSLILGRPAAFEEGLVYGGTKENIKVSDVRLYPGIGVELLEHTLGGPGAPKSIGGRIWGLVNGVDDSEVATARDVPHQVSIEDSYIKLNRIEDVRKELIMLSKSLITRMHVDLSCEDDEAGLLPNDHREDGRDHKAAAPRKWIAHPKRLRISTRPRPPLNADGTRSRTFARISKSCNMPNFVFSFAQDVATLADRLVNDTLMSLFRQLHPENSLWNLSLVNLCATDMFMAATENAEGSGRDIGKMFKRQDDVLREFRVDDIDVPPTQEDQEEELQIAPARSNDMLENETNSHGKDALGSEDWFFPTQSAADWHSDEDLSYPGESCRICGAMMPSFAMIAHERFHALPD